jgi:hypothetical protein
MPYSGGEVEVIMGGLAVILQGRQWRSYSGGWGVEVILQGREWRSYEGGKGGGHTPGEGVEVILQGREWRPYFGGWGGGHTPREGRMSYSRGIILGGWRLGEVDVILQPFPSFSLSCAATFCSFWMS